MTAPATEARQRCPEAYSKGPLVVPEFVYERGIYQVRICLDEPIVLRPDLRELLALCATADVLVERATRLENVREFDMQVLQDIQLLCEKLFPSRPAQETLQSLGLLAIFPYLEQGLLQGRLQVVKDSQGASYFSYVSMLNQLVFMSTQMYHDACNPQHHKYMAHQIALLYQCLNQLQGETKPLRKAIESRFDEIKQVTESQDPVFDAELSDWLQNLAAHCHIEVTTVPSYVHKRLAAVLSVHDPSMVQSADSTGKGAGRAAAEEAAAPQRAL